ncbi:hypothetical protein L1987_31627 [Smallanthus sonchifolius]|uniref:Uncharacterized protein n=1 Tax=Smallanthus sonchifolius TaxID=185202 RepID=A0ACB9I662_9ASTR|nr:hypothetical protein L1987_31627 [Smallanthus sonchifolius]
MALTAPPLPAKFFPKLHQFAPSDHLNTDQHRGRILFSDVVVTRPREVYRGRKWNILDIAKAEVVVLMHLLCGLAPFTFSWRALSVALGLYVVTGLLEGWHNNHHAFEYSARHGLEWWQIDMTWYMIRFLEIIGLAIDVKLPTPTHIQRMAFPPKT